MHRLEQQLKDFVRGGLELFWQRQAMFVGATALTGYYYSPLVALFSYVFCLGAELVDLTISRRIIAWKGNDEVKARKYLNLLVLSTVYSGFAVALFVVLVAYQEGPAIHFAPLFFLFSAALFAAMNNHQLLNVLITRLVIYGLAFLYIPAYDLLVVRPPFNSELWLQFATVLFVLYFIATSSLLFLRLYREGLDQMDALRLERDRATKAYEVQSQFVAVVSHELRTPLTSIKGALGMMNSSALGELPPQAKKATDIAYKNSNRLASLIDDLLDVQKLEAGSMHYKMEPVDLREVITDSIAAIEHFRSSTNVTIKTKGLDAPLRVRGDQDRLMQVMANILSNGIKFSHPGGEIKVSLEQAGDQARIHIKDYGHGIPEGAEDKVFGRFAQVDSSDQRKIGGTGLGLNITKKILEGHGGSISYDSILGVGTEFTVTLEMA